MKRKQSKHGNLRLFFKAAAVSGFCVVCTAFFYLGICASYEAIRSTCFSDDRAAVIVAPGYIKILDFEFWF